MASNPQSSIISRPGGEHGDGGMLYTNTAGFEEREWEEQVDGDREWEDTVVAPEAVDVIPITWKDVKGASIQPQAIAEGKRKESHQAVVERVV